MRGYPQFSFWISIKLVKICFSRIFSKPRKNTFELVGTVLKKLINILWDTFQQKSNTKIKKLKKIGVWPMDPV